MVCSANSPSSAGAWQPVTAPAPVYDAVCREVARLRDLRPLPRPERLAGLHNPWSNTAVQADRWAFLDLCQSTEIVGRVTDLIGPDVVLWDSQLYLRATDYEAFAAAGREGRYWPIYPRAGVVSILSFGSTLRVMHRAISDFGAEHLLFPDPTEPLYVMRYFAATSKFVRDPRFPANWIAMEEQVLINYATRALWLVSGKDGAGNDFVTGFSEQTPTWSARN